MPLKKVMITGVAGFVGVNLARHLLGKGYEVIGLDFNDRHDRLERSLLLEENMFTFEKIDLVKEKVSPSTMDGISTVFHLAALPHVDYSYFYPHRTITNNIEALLNIVESACKSHVPLILASSVEVYGGCEDRIYNEDSITAPLSPYAASKVASEMIIKTYAETQNLSSTIFRFTNLYGRWQAPDRLLPRVIAQIIADNDATIEKGTNRDFVYIDDACKVLEQAIDFDHVGETFNLSTGIRRDNFEVVQKILNHLPASKINVIEPRKKDGRGKYLIASPHKLHEKTNWQAETSLEDGIAATVEWYKKNPAWLSQFSDNISADRNSHDFLTDSNLHLSYWED